jgi:GDP-4-dehydro-6-deoxy-D-mannose reductase
MEKGEAGEAYNVCSGHDLTIGDLAERLVSLAKSPMRLEADPELQRPVETPVLRGDPTRLNSITGWTPQISLETTLHDILDEHRVVVSSRR